MQNIDTIVSSKIAEVFWVQLTQGADLYHAIMDVAEQRKIWTGLVLNIVGGLTKARLSTPMEPGANAEGQPGILEIDGMMECAGIGTIGHNMDTFDSVRKSGILYEVGKPNVHVHLTVNQGPHTHMGHLIEGCKVRSVIAKSHFTIVLARTEGVVLEMLRSKETTSHYPTGVPVHNLRVV